MSENNLWNRLRSKGIFEEATRHEDKLANGIADLSFVCGGRHGWMELKFVAMWPKRKDTVVRVPHFTTAQREFLETKGRCGGNTWLFMQVEDDHLLFSWQNVGWIGHSDKESLLIAADFAWIKRMNYKQLKEALCASS